MKALLLILLSNTLLLSIQAQDGWETWDQNYALVKYNDVIAKEKAYALKVENDSSEVQYFARIDKYKINAKYLGEQRAIEANTLASMKRVFKLFIGNDGDLDNMAKNEFLFEIEGNRVWLPIQQVLEKDFKKETKKISVLSLYCLFINEHSENKDIYNIFFISEFRIE